MALTSLAEIIRTHGRQRPEDTALIFEDRSTSFGQLDERSNRAANALAAAGVGRQDRVAFLDKNGPEYFDVLFGTLKLDAVLVGVNWRLSPPEMAEIISDAEPPVLFVGPEFVNAVVGIRARLPSVTTIVAIGEGGPDDWERLEPWLSHADSTDPAVDTGSEQVALQLYTSGTTGLPKGVMLTNANLTTLMFEVGERWRLGPGKVSMAVMPMFHIAGSGWALVSLAHGCTTVILRDVDPPDILRQIEQHGVTNVLFVPAVLQFLLITPGAADTDFSSLDMVVYGASPITETTLTASVELLGCDFAQVYGLTETTGAIAQLDPDDHDPAARPELLRSCGKPYPWVEVRIVDPDTGTDMEIGAVGELWARSRQIMAGYWHQPAATTEAITDEGWFRTGDAGYLDTAGYLYLHDRVKDMIVSGGENIYPAEVENVLAKHPDVADVAVIGVPDDRWGEAVKAIVVRRDGSTASGDDLVAAARDHLAGFKLPKSVDFIEVLPRNPSGKILKRELREPYWAGRDRQIG